MRSIRSRLLKELLWVLITLEVLGGLVACIAAAHESYERFDDALDAKAQAIGTLTFSDGEGVKVVFTDRYFRGFDDRVGKDYFEMWDSKGKVVARSESFPTGELPRRFGTPSKPMRWNGDMDGVAVRMEGFVFNPKPLSGIKGVKTPEFSLVIASHRGALRETVVELSSITLGAAVILALATVIAVPRMLRRGLAPLDDLADRVTRIHAESLAKRLEMPELPTELAPIVTRLNELLERLQASFERERRFNADLAHELRTPIAELRSVAECALKWPESRTGESDRDVLAVATQMEALVTHMLQLARGEAGQLSVSMAPIDLRVEAESIWAALAERAKRRSLQATFSFSASAVQGDPALVRSILTNLLDNAVEYGAEHGVVEVKAWSESGVVRFSVGNLATDISEGDVPKLFDRFWRKEEARSGGRHAGLGLALSRELASAMGWSLEARLGPDRWLSFVLTTSGSA